MTRRFGLALFVSMAGMASAVATQQPSVSVPQGPAIRLRAATFSPARAGAPPIAANQLRTPAATPPGEFLVQFQGPVQESWKAALVAAGVDLLEYVPDFAFRVRASAELAGRLRQLPFVAWAGPYHPAYKLATPSGGAEEQPYIIRLERDADAAVVGAALGATGTRVTRRGASLLMIVAPPAQLVTIAQIEGVASVEPFALRVKHNEFGGGVIMGGRIAGDRGFDGSSQILAVADTGLGNGTAGGAHPDIQAERVRSILNYPGTPDFCFEQIVNDGAADVDSGHGTHVATAALGAGNPLGIGRGTAPAAGLVFQAVENYAVPSLLCGLIYGVPEGYYLVGLPGDLRDLYQPAYDSGARVHSDSWGSAVDGAYTADAENTDAFVWAHRDMAITFSAGNSGVDLDGDGTVDPMSVGSPATAKNVITVGASENDRQSHWECDAGLSYTSCGAQGGQNTIFAYGAAWPDAFPANPLRDDPSAGNAEQMAAFSSRGPTTDGRIKPDVVAPGTWTLSGYADLYQQQYDAAPNPRNASYQYDGWGFPADASHKYMGGTSMAAPLVGGGAAVVRDFYQKAHLHQASAALVKATLINSAVDLLDENNDGVLDNALPIPNMHEGWGRVDLANATDNSHQFSDEGTPLVTGATATFTYVAPEAGSPFKATLVWTDFPSTPTAAANLVNDLDLTVVAPDGTVYLGNAFAGGWSVVGGSPDRVNNVENVYLSSAAAGTWTVIVSGYNVPMGPQPFALVVDNAPQGSSLPIVRASADDATATEAGLTGGVVRVMRGGDTSSALTVFYTVSGTATAGTDYAALSGTVTIPEGSSSATVFVNALDDERVEPDETVTITLTSDASYTVASPSSAAVTITSDDVPPDLVIASVTAPSAVAAGSIINVTETTRSQGTAAAGVSETGFYLSANSTLDASDVFLGSRVVSALPAGSSEQVTSSLVVPESTVAGMYYVVAKADWAGLIEETNDANNTRASSSVRVGPDLIVSAVSVPSAAAAGGVVHVGDTTKNQGAGAALATMTGFYLSSNSTWDAGDVYLGRRAVSPLSGGAMQSASTALTIPAATSDGSYYILARADSEDSLIEYSENNNVRAGTVRIGADLVVTALTAPATAGAGDAIAVAETTKNAGGAEAPESMTEYYLSVNTGLDANDVRLGSRPVPVLGAGSSSSASLSLTIPAGTAFGSYYVLAKADGPGAVDETSETNNVKASGVMKIGADLTVVSLVAPSTSMAGGTLSIAETVKNQGGAPSAATESAFYLSANTILDAGDLDLGRRPVPPLDASASSAATVALVLPVSLATGSYYILSKVDPAGVVDESLESNNVKTSGAVRVGPDLIVPSLSGPSTAVRGTGVVVSDTTRNQGGGAAGASVTRFYLSANSSLDGSDLLLGSRAVAALSAGAASVASTSLAIPAGTVTGSYYVIARTDDDGVVVETAEANNTRSLALRIDP